MQYFQMSNSTIKLISINKCFTSFWSIAAGMTSDSMVLRCKKKEITVMYRIFYCKIFQLVIYSNTYMLYLGLEHD